MNNVSLESRQWIQTVKVITRHPFVAIPLGTALVVLFLEGWSSLQRDPLVINQVFLLLLFLLPLLAAFSLVFVHKIKGKTHGGWVQWALQWIGSTLLAGIVALAVHAVWSISFPYTPTEAAAYNYPHFGYSFYRQAERRRLASGEKALEETLFDLEGNEVPLSQLWEERPIVVEFGSITCSVFVSKIPRMDALAKEYDGRVDFYVLYVREAHPGQNYSSHQSFEQKLRYANDLQRLEGMERPILVDGFEGAMNQDYGPMPNSVYIIGRDGVIAYRADWNDPEGVKSQLDALLEQGGYASRVPPVNVSRNFARPGRTPLRNVQGP